MTIFDETKMFTKDELFGPCDAKTWRRRWMSLMGFKPTEILYHIQNDPPSDIEEEKRQFDAAVRLSSQGPLGSCRANKLQ